MLARLAPVETVANDSLRSLLEDERIHGTKERDLTAPRPEYYYFKHGSKYLLIEDATGRHRAVMMKEYHIGQKDGSGWPTLFESFLRPSSSTSAQPSDQVRQRAWTLYVERKPFGNEAPPVSDLKRSPCLGAIPGTPKLPEALPYQNASGNSVVLTSNIASTSTANHSPALFGPNNMGGFKDRALLQMNRRVQVLKGNARLAAAKRQKNELDLSGLPSNRPSSSTLSSTMSQAPPPQKSFMTQDQLIKMLQQARAPVHETHVTAEMRIKNREKVDAGLKGREQDVAPGYCENCRLRYNDLSVVSDKTVV